MPMSLEKIVICLAYTVLCWVAEIAYAHGPSRATVEKAQTLRLQGEAYLRDKRPRDAIKVFAESYSLFQSPGVLMLLGRALLENGQYHDAAEFCQRFLREQPNAREAYVASMCRTMAVASGSGETLVDINDLGGTSLRDLNLADVHMLLENYTLAEKFAEHFLSEVSMNSKARLYAIQVLRRALTFQGKRDPYQRQPRPLWRKALSGISVAAGIGMTVWGITALIYDGGCIDGPFSLDPALNRVTGGQCQSIYETSAYGGSVLSIGITVLSLGTIGLAIPGNLPQEAHRAMSAASTIRPLGFVVEF